MTKRWETASGGSEWIALFGDSETHWATHQKRGFEYRWMTACRRRVDASHFHKYGRGWLPASSRGGSRYDGTPLCPDCKAVRQAVEASADLSEHDER